MPRNRTLAVKDNKPVSQRVEGWYRTAEWLIVAFSFTLVFIVFEMQAYTIPTGSMAETLKGAHFHLRCEQCGMEYDFDYLPGPNYGRPDNSVDGGNIPIIPAPPRCPSCGFYRTPAVPLRRLEGGREVASHPQLRSIMAYQRDKIYVVRRVERRHNPQASGGVEEVPVEEWYYVDSPAVKHPVLKGDRIFVLKCIYQFLEPKRWDVVVFKNPLEPRINYIKRMIGLPGEKVEIIDGDIYINDRIARKPPRVQDELWMVVYDNDYLPKHPETPRFNGHAWTLPFSNVAGARWQLNPNDRPVFHLRSEADGGLHTISYDATKGNDFRATYAYDDPRAYEYMPICSDLRVHFVAGVPDDGQPTSGRIGAGLSKYGVRYRGIVDVAGRIRLERITEGGTVHVLLDEAVDLSDVQTPAPFSLANVDHELVLTFGPIERRVDLGTDRDAMGSIRPVMPEVTILGAGRWDLRHVRIERDLHYISEHGGRAGRETVRAGEGNPFTLGPDEFFVCGDNSPNSMDARLWDRPGSGNRRPDGTRADYRAGTVPRDYLVGKAFFVYWPGPFKPFNDTRLARWLERHPAGRIAKIFLNVPRVDGMKLIYGGQR